MTRIAITIFSVVLLAGCATFTPQPRMADVVELPESYSLFPQGESSTNQWWKGFNSMELDYFVSLALRENFALKEAWARLKQASAVAKEAGADLWPQLSYSGTALQRSEFNQSNGHTSSRRYTAGLAASYEVDLWGRLDAVVKSEELEAGASRYDAGTVAMSLAASVAETWVNILAVREELRIVEKQIETNRNLTELLELRFANSKATALDVNQQREVLAASAAELPILKAREEVLLNFLGVLVGKVPGSLSVTQNNFPALIPLPDVGLPADLLAARPDIQAASLRLRSADWDVSAARANRLPSVTLSASGVLQSAVNEALFSGWITTLTGAIAGPLFDGGRLAAEVDRTRAVAEERVAQYGGVVLAAISEVENSMVNERRQREYLDKLTRQLETVDVALGEAGLRYQMGQVDYLTFVTQLQNKQQLERTLLVQQSFLLIYRINLYRALGGDWSNSLPVETGE